MTMEPVKHEAPPHDPFEHCEHPLCGDSLACCRCIQKWIKAADAHDDFKQSNELLRKALGQLAVAQERIVTLEKALRAVEWAPIANAEHRQCPSCHGAFRFGYCDDACSVRHDHAGDCQTDAALCDHRGDCTHSEGK